MANRWPSLSGHPLKHKNGSPKQAAGGRHSRIFRRGCWCGASPALPKFAPWLKAVTGQVVDLLKPFWAFDYYHPEQHGSASMKAVLPALTGKGYGVLAIQEGGTASNEFLRVTFGDVPVEERRRVRQQLEEYCGRETAGMVWITDALRRIK